MKLPQAIAHYISHNDHTTFYQSVEEYLADEVADFDQDEITDQDREECIRTGEVWKLQWYPTTPVGFCVVLGPTLERVLARANGEG